MAPTGTWSDIHFWASHDLFKWLFLPLMYAMKELGIDNNFQEQLHLLPFTLINNRE